MVLTSINKKVILIGIFSVAICLIISAYMLNRQSESSKRKELNLKSSEVEQINISTMPSFFKAFDIVNEEQISSVVDYLTSLNKIETKLDPSDYVGGGYSIKMNLKNGGTREFIHSGNKFFIEPKKFTYEMPYEEAIKFDTIVANILESNESKTGRSSTTGTVVSVNSEAIGSNVSCIIKDKGNTTYKINLKNANIIDATGNGRLILHKEDIVKIFYGRDDQTNNDNINALTVYIKKATE